MIRNRMALISLLAVACLFAGAVAFAQGGAGGSDAPAPRETGTPREPGTHSGPGGPDGHDKRGPGGPDQKRQGPRPMFGVVTAVSADSITIKPEVPEFVKQKMEQRRSEMQQRKSERGGKGSGQRGGGKGAGQRGPGGSGGPGGPGKGPRELPESLTATLSAETHFYVNGEQQSGNPFKVGDRVAIMAHGAPGQFSARAVSDYATAEARMDKRMEQRGERREKRQERRQQRRDGVAQQ